MQKMQKKKLSLQKATHRLAVHKDSNGLLLAPTLCSERSATPSIGCPTRETHFIFGPAVAALRLAQIQTQTQIALRQIAILASIVLGHRCDLTATLPPHLALLSLLTRQQVSTFGLEGTTNRQISTIAQPSRSAAMYHQQSQQQGSQPFLNASRPPHHPPSASQHPNHPNMQGMGFQFPRPNQLPDELESALRGTRDMDHRQMDLMNQSNQHQNQGTGIGQHGSYGSNPMLLPADSQSGHQQGVDWSNYQAPTKLFATTQQQPQGSQSGARILNWNPPISDSPAPQTRQPLGDGGRMEGQGLYTPESAGSILASFGLSNDDLEVLSHYPDDQLTPDTLPFILRDIQLKKSGKQKSVSATSSSSYSHNVTPTGSSHSAEVPSLLTVTQTAGKVIDYGHASRGTEESGTRETFKREQLSSERTVKMLPTAASSSVSKVEKTERRQVRVEHKEPIKHGDRDYRKTTCEKRKNSRSPVREFAPLPKSRNLDRDYRQVESKQRPPSETRSEDSSRRSPSSSSASRHGSSKKLPTPTMISDFTAVFPKVFPHTCSLCHIQCDQEKDWVDHINTVDHTAACRDLRNKYPDWKPNLPSRSWRYGSRSPFGSAPRSHSRSPTSPHGKYRREPFMHRPHGRPYSPPRHPRPHYHTDHGHWNKYPYSGSHGPHYSHREPWPDRRHRESSGDFSHHGVKHPHDALTKISGDRSRTSSSSAAGHGSKHAATKPSTKTIKPTQKPATKTTKAVKNLPVKKKKKVAGPASQGTPLADRLVYLTGIPIDATEQEVTDLVSSFGKINNVILLPCSEEESEKGQGQKASVCMMKTEDAQALASASELCIREQPITALVAKKPEDAQLSEGNSKTEAENKDKESAGNTSGSETDQKTSDQKWNVLVSGLPHSGWSDGDIAELVQSVGAPSDIILAKHVGKALVSFRDLEVAEELVKVHSFKPAMFKDTEVKMTLVKKQIGLSTPVALYNLFTGSLDPLDGSAPVGWNSLVVIKNVPDSPGSSTEVLKLMRRFGTVIKFLVVNSMIICEMATTAMALSVYKRFLMFPCIIQNNPLIFYRKADPKAQPPTKIIPACCETAEDKPPEDAQAAAEPSEQEAESQPDHCEDPPEKDEDENTKTEEKTEEENLTERESKDDCVEEEDEELGVSVSSPASDARPDEDVGDAENTEVQEDAGESEVENVEETQAPCSDAGSVSPEMAMPELPKMTQAMVNALLEECRTRTANKMAAPPSEDQGQEDQEKRGEDATDTTEEKDEEAKKLDRERKEREVKKEKERKERERREREKEMERRERREWEKKEWERRKRERRRGYDERSFGSRSSYRPGSYRQRDEHYREAERRKEEPEEPEDDEFPFNLSDFVTVDELGDVTELPDAAVSMETSAEGGVVPQTEQEEEHMEISVEATATQEKEPEHVESPTAEAVSSLDSGQDPSDGDAPPEDSHVHTGPSETADQPEASDDGMKPDPDAALSSSLDVEPISTSSAPAVPSPSTCSSTAAAAEPEEESRRRKSSPADHDEEKNEEKNEKNEEKNEKNEEKNEKNEEKNEKNEEKNEKNEEKNEKNEEKNEKNEEKNEKNEEKNEKNEEKNEESNEPQQSQDEENMNEAPAEPETSAAEELPDVLQKEKTKKAKDTREESVKKPLPPYDPSAAVGLEYLVPKTGFFCKVCSRFFTGAKAAEISHCKTLKHYENLQKFLLSPESSVKTN